MAREAKLDHAELASKDPAATQKHLEAVFGLKWTVMGPEMGNYRMHGRQEGAKASSLGIRGLMDKNEHPGTIPYLTVPNLDDALKAAKAAGGHVVQEKTEIPNVAWIAVYIAPGDLPIGLYQSKSA